MLFDQRHDLVAGDVAPLLAQPQEALDVREGTDCLLKVGRGHLILWGCRNAGREAGVSEVSAMANCYQRLPLRPPPKPPP